MQIEIFFCGGERKINWDPKKLWKLVGAILTEHDTQKALLHIVA